MYYKRIFIGLIFMAASVMSSENYYSKLDFVSLESLGTIEIYTADRRLTSVSKTSSIVTVITAQQIKKQGLKNIEDVLRRVPGMFLEFKNRVQPFIYHRGIQQDQNTGLLLLVDGVSQNSKVAYGFDAQHLLPHLFNVKQIEIIRGSSSTLWGSEAVTSVVNIITYTGSDLDSKKEEDGIFKAAYTHGFRDQSDTVDLLWAKKFDNGDVMTSINYANSDGDLQPYRLLNNELRHTAWETLDNSYNIYLNSSYKNFKLTAKYLRYNHPDAQDFIAGRREASSDEITSQRIRTFFTIDLKHHLQISKVISLDTNIGYGDNELRKTEPALSAPGTYVETTDAFFEKSKYLEAILNYNIDTWNNMIGVKFTGHDLYIKKDGGDDLNHRTDLVRAIFFQSSYTGIKDLKVVVGLRVSHSALRSLGDKEVMPKVSVVYALTDKWSTRYVYSTGFIHTMFVHNNGRDGFEYNPLSDTYSQGTKLPQEVKTNEFQIAYKDNTLETSLTLFHVEINDLIGWIGETAPEGSNYIYTYSNTELIKSIGLEYEFKYRHDEDLDFYGNFTYQDSYYGSENASNGSYSLKLYEVNQEVQNVPNTIYNVGMNYYLTESSSLNVHYRGYNGLLINEVHYGLQSFVDFNYRYEDFYMDNLDISVYGKNIFDNQKLNDQDVFSKTEAGSDFGFSLEYTF